MPPLDRRQRPARLAIRQASAALDKTISELTAARASLAALRLPVPGAETRLDHTDDLLAVVLSQANSAASVINGEIERLEQVEATDYVRDHGLSAASVTQMIDRDFARWEATLERAA